MRERQHVSEQLRHEIAMICRDESGRPHLLPTVHVYDAAEPFAVTIVFHTRGLELPWTFSREVLMLGQVAPVGDGDVRVWPGVDRDGVPIVLVKLGSPDGSLVVEAPAVQVRDFLEASVSLVPRGAESDHLDLDRLIEELLTAGS